MNDYGNSVGNYLAVSNAADIGMIRGQLRAQMRLSEFSERAQTVARLTGITPMGFFAYEKANPTPKQHNMWAPLLWAGLGAIVAGILAATWPAIMAAAAVGAVVGVLLPESEVSRLNRALDKYDSYLTQTEVAAQSQARSRVQDMSGIAVRTNHAASISAAREAEELSAASKSI